METHESRIRHETLPAIGSSHASLCRRFSPTAHSPQAWIEIHVREKTHCDHVRVLAFRHHVPTNYRGTTCKQSQKIQ